MQREGYIRPNVFFGDPSHVYICKSVLNHSKTDFVDFLKYHINIKKGTEQIMKKWQDGQVVVVRRKC